MRGKKTVIFPAFRHLHPSDLEQWLESMAAKGWHIDKFRQWSSLFMTFRQGEPKRYRFVYDLQVSPRKEYIATYEQFGWEYLGRMASAHMWRMGYDEKRPEAFSDPESIMKRNRRNIRAASVSFFIFLIATLTVGILLAFFTGSLSRADRIQMLAAEILFGIITIALGAVIALLKRKELS